MVNCENENWSGAGWISLIVKKQQAGRNFTIQSHGAVFIQPPSGFATADGVPYEASWPKFHHSPFNRRALYSPNRRQGFQPLTGFTTQQDDRNFTIHHSIAWRCIHPTAVRVCNRWRGSLRSKMTELSPFNRMELYSSNRRQDLQPLTGFTTQQADRTFTIHHWPFTKLHH